MQGRQIEVDLSSTIDIEEKISSIATDRIRYYINPLSTDIRENFRRISGGIIGMGLAQGIFQLSMLLGEAAEANVAAQDIVEVEAIKNLFTAKAAPETSQQT